jgi:acetyltransferase-like isoleucine patch superfamily enzyme
MQLAPIVLFVYNRPDHTRRTLEALSVNELADQSTLYIYADGPKYGALPEDLDRIRDVRAVVRSQPWCKEVTIIESEYNKGLADSIVSGVTEVVNRHGRVIVLEDDIVTRKGFLRYMNEALEVYADDDRVMHVSGMIFGTPRCVGTEGTSFLRILSCHGWATWQRAWAHYCHDVDALLEGLKEQGISESKFDIEGNAHFYAQLVANRDGRLRTWAVRWYASWLTSGGFSLFPHRSLITNIGHDQTGTHTSAPFYNGETIDHLVVTRIPVTENTVLRQEMDEIWRKGRRATRTKHPFSLRRYVRSFLRIGLSPLQKYARRLLTFVYPELKVLDNDRPEYALRSSHVTNSTIAPTAALYPPHQVWNSSIGDYSYVAHNAWISFTRIGNFCSIGPNFHCGWGIHPLDGISTSPMFYSTARQNGSTLCSYDKVQERKPIHIGNDVFIGMNVTILDGVTVGNGAVIGAGTIVSKDVPPYAIVVGNPMRILRFRFSEETVKKLLETAWWDWPIEELQRIERHFFDVEGFVSKYSSDSDHWRTESPEQDM